MTDNYNTELFEHLHIDLAKEGWRASNTRNVFLQMIKWLERQEKIEMFGRYVSSLEEQGNELLMQTVRIVLAKHLTVHSQPIHSIEALHSAPYFSRDLKHFLNSLLPPGQTVSHAQLQYMDADFHAWLTLSWQPQQCHLWFLLCLMWHTWHVR